jgi:predicted KAP-like P-loop ATPase
MTALSADRPSTDPNDDLFGLAPFAKTLANSICGYAGTDGLVLALYGPWGSGKSTVLSYVTHYVEQRPAEEQPVVVTFNPWWFSGQENLARAFLGQMQAVLPEKHAGFKQLGEKISEFSEGIGSLIELAGAAAGVGGVVQQGLKWVARKPKDIPALKNEIRDILLNEKKRILVIIDDIDRLTPEEVRQLFTVIKALADFPNVVYLLAFDREVAVDAIKQQMGMPGERFLEKIIQVPFEIPPVDRVALHAALCKRLDQVLVGTPDGLFDQAHWDNVFHDGVGALIKVPRDIVRFSNTLSVTYPAVVGDVNPVDFIAIEALRVFLPNVYDVVRSNPDEFSGHRSGAFDRGKEGAAIQAFHDAWLKEVPEKLRDGTMAMLQRIFPKLENMTYGGEWVAKWRRELRVCVPELFPTYFRLAVPSGAIRRSEMVELLALAKTPDLLAKKLIAAVLEIRPDGITKARALLERLQDYVEKDIPDDDISTFITVLFDAGDDIVVSGDRQGSFDFGNESRVTRVVYHLLKRIDPAQRLTLLRDAINQGRGVGVQCYLLLSLRDEITKKEAGKAEPMLDVASFDELKAIWVEQVRTTKDKLLTNPQFRRILSVWKEWGNAEEVQAWCAQVTKSDEGLLAFLPHFCSHTTSQSMGDWAVRVRPRLNPKSMEAFLDTNAVATRLIVLNQAGQVSEPAKESVTQFLKEFEMIKAGKNPEAMDAFDD